MKQTAGDSGREASARELKSLIPQLDAEGLAFLAEQARIHLYNMQVEKLNGAAENVRTAGAARAAGKPEPGNGPLRIGGSATGSSFYLYYGNNEVMFSRDEMTHLVKIANGEEDGTGTGERLYNWFCRERADVFAAVPVTGKSDPRLKALAALLKKSFKLRER